MEKRQKRIIHLDMDAFYASVESLDDPRLAGKPVIVGGASSRGVVSAASYAARKFGVHSAMSVVKARKICPNGIFIRPRMSRYNDVSKVIMAIFHRYTPLVEPLSLDEAFLDVTGSEKLFGTAVHIAESVRKQVAEEIGLTVSAGIATSKLVAKIASDMDKPDGLTVVPEGMDRQFVTPLPISKLWGVGRVMQKQLALLGVATIGDLSKLSRELLSRKFGKHGIHLYYASRAIDSREVEPFREIKSIGHEETFADDIVDLSVLEKELLSLSVRVGRRLRSHGVMARTIIIKTKYYDFIQTTKSKTLQQATDDSATLYRNGCKLLYQTLAGKKPMRLLGITAANLVETGLPTQGLLFTQSKSEHQKNLNQAVDTITNKYGSNVLKPGTLVEKNKV